VLRSFALLLLPGIVPASHVKYIHAAAQQFKIVSALQHCVACIAGSPAQSETWR
jgi:hypothetical protein